MSINAFSVQVTAALLDGSTTQLPTPGSAETGTVTEAFGGLPMRIPGGASDQAVYLGSLSNPKWLAVYGGDDISFRLVSGGTVIKANPFAFVADVDNGLGSISMIYVTNAGAAEAEFTVLAAE